MNSVAVADLDRLLQGTPSPGTLLLDVRGRLASQQWRPEGPGISAFANVPYDEFEQDADAALSELPPASSIYVICARGISSQEITAVLEGRGLNAINVNGGMAAWSAHHRMVRLNDAADPFAIHQVVRPAKGCMSYIISAGAEALIIDPTRYRDVYFDFTERNGLRVAAVADTHLHADHLSGSVGLSQESGASYHLSDEDAEGATIPRESMPKSFHIGGTSVQVLTLPVPGHTLGSTALLVGDRYLISGDTLLPESVGRPDLGNKAREWTELLYESLSGTLGRLNADVAVLPAHAAAARQFDSRGACERRLGDVLATAAIGDREAFMESVEQRVSSSSQPAAYAEIRRINLGEPASPQRAEQLEVGMNQCALASAKA